MDGRLGQLAFTARTLEAVLVSAGSNLRDCVVATQMGSSLGMAPPSWRSANRRFLVRVPLAEGHDTDPILDSWEVHRQVFTTLELTLLRI